MNKPTVDEILTPKPEARPRIYAYAIADSAHDGLLKVGQTTRNVKQRVAEQLKTAAIANFTIELDESAERDDGGIITDHAVRETLRRKGFNNRQLEWMQCTVADVKTVLAELRTRFRPEFLNRVDDTVLFKPLTATELERIVDLMLDEVRGRLLERRISLDVSEATRHFIAQRGFDPVYGARPLRRFIAREVETRIGRALLSEDVRDGAVITVELREGELEVRCAATDEGEAI